MRRQKVGDVIAEGTIVVFHNAHKLDSVVSGLND